MSSEERATVLVVDDEAALVDIYARWLGDDYDVRTATSGAGAVEALDDAVDVALLDRRMPEMSGDEVLAEVRDRAPECRVAMVTAVEPDFDIMAMGFDAYLRKPVDREELVGTVERLRSRQSFADLERELHALVSKRAALQSAKTEEDLGASEEYAALEREIDQLRTELDETLPGMDDDELVAMVREIEDTDAEPGADESDTAADRPADRRNGRE